MKEFPTKINMGCGPRNFGPDWYHVDGGNYNHTQCRNIGEIPYNMYGQTELIYASHLIAYFDRNEIVPIFEDWFKILKPGGTLRIATPDFEALRSIYITKGAELSDLLGPMYGRMKMGSEYIYHKTIWDFVSLQKFLTGVGFVSYKTYDFRDTEHSQFDDHSMAHFPHDPESIKTGNFKGKKLISLNVECKKPIDEGRN